MKKMNEMKEHEFSELLSKTNFLDKKENVDEDGDELKEIKEEVKIKNSNYLAIATNFALTILSPVILLLIIYFTYLYYFDLKSNEIVIVVLIFIGVLSGYWNLYKDINKIDGKRGKNESKDKKTK